MALKSAQVTVGTTAVEITGADKNPGNGSSVLLKPVADVFVGGSDVTAATGFLVPAGSSLSYDLTGETEQMFAVTASGSTVVYVLRGRA